MSGDVDSDVDMLALVHDLASQVDELRARLDAPAAADADLPIVGIRAIARAAGVAPGSLKRWVRDADAAERRKLSVLLQRTATGRWATSQRLITHWRQAFFSNPWTGEVSR